MLPLVTLLHLGIMKKVQWTFDSEAENNKKASVRHLKDSLPDEHGPHTP